MAVVASLDEDDGKYRRHLWRIDLGGEDSVVQLTHGDQECHGPRFRHDGTLAFLSSRAASKDAETEGPGATQVWAFPDTGGEPVPLTDEPLGVTGFRCARRADVLAVWTSRLPGVPEAEWRATARARAKKGPTGLHYRSQPTRFWDHWRPDARPVLVVQDAAGRRQITPDADAEFEHVEWDLAPDGSFAVVTERRIGSDRIPEVAVTRLDLSDGTRRVLLSEERVSFGALFLSPDGRRLLAGRWARVEDRYPSCRAGVLELETGDWALHGENWSLEGLPAGWQDQSTVLLTAADHGLCTVYTLDTETGERTRRTDSGAWAGVTAIGDRFVGLRSDLLHPPEVHVCDADGLVSTPGRVAGEGSLAEQVRWESHTTVSKDGASVQWFEVSPKAIDGRLPGLIWVHGGPISSWQDTWHWRWCSALFALEGYVLCLPNPRGSTGFGHAFVQGIWNNRWGAECYDDVLACADAFASLETVDADNVGLMGGSFGGYMANQMGATTDRFRCLVSHAGLFDFTAFYGATDFPAFWAWQLACHPYMDRAAFETWSPSRRAAQWKTPTLVVHGEKDYRVPIGEGLALFEALQLHQVESELLVFPDEGHWIQRPENIVVWHQVIFDFLGRHLQPR